MKKATEGNQCRSVSMDAVCEAASFRDEMGISGERWTMLIRAGLPVITCGRKTIIVVSEVIEFLKSKPKLGELPSTIRKRRMIERKAKAK
jgi:hypothetical protein